MSIDQGPPERDVQFPPLAPKFVPDEAELLGFAQAKLALLGWSVAGRSLATHRPD